MWDPEFALEKEILTDPYRSIQIHTRFWDPASRMFPTFPLSYWEAKGRIPETSMDLYGSVRICMDLFSSANSGSLMKI